MAKLFADSGTVAIASFISPYRADREAARGIHAAGGEALPFVEVYVQASVEECEARDPKGLYRKARSGEIKEFTGVSAPYEAPERAEVVVKTGERSVEEGVADIVKYLVEKGLVDLKD